MKDHMCESFTAPFSGKDIDMSAFLGPIHHWLYHKIQFQEEWIQSILNAAEQNGWGSFAEKLDADCGPADLRSLEESIDQGNIHGWLQQKIHVEEARFAVLVTELLKADASRISELEEISFRFGQSHSVPEGTDAAGAFLRPCQSDSGAGRGPCRVAADAVSARGILGAGRRRRGRILCASCENDTGDALRERTHFFRRRKRTV